jgi:hypothetical protein
MANHPASQRFLMESRLGVANGVAPLGPDGKVPAAQLPASTGGGGGVGTVVSSTDPNSRGAAGTDPSISCLFLVPGSVQPPAMLANDVWFSSLSQ